MSFSNKSELSQEIGSSSINFDFVCGSKVASAHRSRIGIENILLLIKMYSRPIKSDLHAQTELNNKIHFTARYYLPHSRGCRIPFSESFVTFMRGHSGRKNGSTSPNLL